MACQAAHHLQRKPLPSFAICAGVSAATGKPVQQALHRRLIDHLLAGAISRKCLSNEHGKRFRRRKEPLPMGWQSFLDLLEQRVAGEEVEGAQAVGFKRPRLDKALLVVNGSGGMIVHVTGP